MHVPTFIPVERGRLYAAVSGIHFKSCAYCFDILLCLTDSSFQDDGVSCSSLTFMKLDQFIAAPCGH